MNKVYIISTRSMKDSQGIWLLKDWSIKIIRHDSPFVQHLLKDCDGSCVSSLTDYLTDKNGWDYEKAYLWVLDQLKEKSPREFLEDNGESYTEWVDYTLNKRDKSVSSLPWDHCYYLEKDNMRVIVVQHLPFHPTMQESKGWVSSLLDTFSSKDEEVCLILHAKDLEGFEHKVSYLLSESEMKRFTQRENTSIIVFEHNGSKVSSIFANESADVFWQSLSSIKRVLESDLASKNSGSKMA